MQNNSHYSRTGSPGDGVLDHPRTDIVDMVEKTAGWMDAYMSLHRGKGFIQDTPTPKSLQGVNRNYEEFIAAVVMGDRIETLAEGIGLIDHVAMYLYNKGLQEGDPQAMRRMLEERGGIQYDQQSDKPERSG